MFKGYFLGSGLAQLKIYSEIYIMPRKEKMIPTTSNRNRDLGSSEISNIDEVDGIYLASPRGLR